MLYSRIPTPQIPQSNSPLSPPRWARLIDLLAVVIVFVSLVIAMSGGFRVHVGDARFALTSPWRLLIWAIVLAVVRHVLAPAAPIYRDVPARIAAVWASSSTRAAARVFFGTRIAILAVGYLAVFLIGFRPPGPPWKADPNEFINLQARHDAGWYLNVATEGYKYEPAAPPDYQQNVVFFPAYPMAMRSVARLFGGETIAYLFGGTAVSFLAFFWALAYLYRFSRDLLGDTEQAEWALWLLAAYPFALFFSALYSESLYLLAIVGACFHFRRGEYGRAAIWGLVAGLDRAPGCFLSIVLGLMAISPWLPPWLSGGPAADRAQTASRTRRIVPALASAAMPGVGVLIFSAYIWSLTGHPLTWEAGHVAWGRQYAGLSVLIADRAEFIRNQGLYAYTQGGGIDIMNGLGALFVIAAAWPVARRLGLPYAVLILINIVPPLAAGGFMSTGRFSSVLFPAFVWLASAVPVRQRPAWLAAFMTGQAFCAILFYTWRPLY